MRCFDCGEHCFDANGKNCIDRQSDTYYRSKDWADYIESVLQMPTPTGEEDNSPAWA